MKKTLVKNKFGQFDLTKGKQFEMLTGGDTHSQNLHQNDKFGTMPTVI